MSASADDCDYWRQLRSDWTQTERPGEEADQWRARFTDPRPGREHLMDDDERDLVASLPDRVRVYRGAVRGVNETGLSWGVEHDAAMAWASASTSWQPSSRAGMASSAGLSGGVGNPVCAVVRVRAPAQNPDRRPA